MDGAGAVYLQSGSASMAVRALASDATASLQGETADDALGFSLAGPGDVDGDGALDLLVGAPGADSATVTDSGAVFLAPGPFAGSRAVSSTGAQFYGSNPSDALGVAVAGLGDTNNDGLPDFAMGAPSADDSSLADSGAWFFCLGSGL